MVETANTGYIIIPVRQHKSNKITKQIALAQAIEKESRHDKRSTSARDGVERAEKTTKRIVQVKGIRYENAACHQIISDWGGSYAHHITRDTCSDPFLMRMDTTKKVRKNDLPGRAKPLVNLGYPGRQIFLFMEHLSTLWFTQTKRYKSFLVIIY